MEPSTRTVIGTICGRPVGKNGCHCLYVGRHEVIQIQGAEMLLVLEDTSRGQQGMLTKLHQSTTPAVVTTYSYIEASHSGQQISQQWVAVSSCL